MISSSMILAFSFTLILKHWSGPPNSTMINHPTFRCPFNHAYTSDQKETTHHCLPLWLHHCCFVSVGICFNNTRHFRLMYGLISILVTILAEQHKTVTLKQSSGANQLMLRDESSPVWFNKLQFSFTKASCKFPPAECQQSSYLIATPRICNN